MCRPVPSGWSVVIGEGYERRPRATFAVGDVLERKKAVRRKGLAGIFGGMQN